MRRSEIARSGYYTCSLCDAWPVLTSRSGTRPERIPVPFVGAQFIVSERGSVGRRTEIGRERPKQTVHAIESYREVTVDYRASNTLTDFFTHPSEAAINNFAIR